MWGGLAAALAWSGCLCWVLCKCVAMESRNSSEQQTSGGEAELFLGFKGWLKHLICDRKLGLADTYHHQKKALEVKVEKEKPLSEQDSSRPNA